MQIADWGLAVLRRVLTAIVLLAAVIAAILYSNRVVFTAILAVFVLLATREYIGLARLLGAPPFESLQIVGAAVLLALFAWDISLIPATLFALCLAAALATLTTQSRMNQSLARVSATCFGWLYLPLTLGWLVPLRFDIGYAKLGIRMLFLLLVVIWAGDIFAYFVGRAIGRHKLAPRISPGKTVEGFVGGMLGNLAAAAIYHHFQLTEFARTEILLIALAFGTVGQLADLFESVLKRGAGVKDSSSILPGHGGVLDRIDSLLLATPVLYFYLWWRFSGGEVVVN